MIRLQRINHIGLPADDLERARDFYTRVLGLSFQERHGGQADEKTGRPSPKLDVLRCPNGDEVVLFEKPLARYADARAGVGLLHHAFDLNWEDFDEALATAQELGTIDRVIERNHAKDIYLSDSEGNYLQLHFAPPAGGVAPTP